MTRGRNKIMKSLVFLLTAVFYQISFSASFNCHNASTWVEKEICLQSDLSDLDEEIASLYSIMRTKKVVNIQVNQRKWLQERNKCGNRDCLKKIMNARVGDMTKSLGLRIIKLHEVPIYEGNSEYKNLINDQIILTASGAPCLHGGDYEFGASIAFEDERYFSWAVWYERFCNENPYPTIGGHGSYIYNLDSGQQISFEQLFFKYDENKKLIHLSLLEEFIKKLKDEEMFEQCREFYDPDSFQDAYFVYDIEESKIIIERGLPHAFKQCRFTIKIPYKNINKFARKNGLIQYMVNKNEIPKKN